MNRTNTNLAVRIPFGTARFHLVRELLGWMESVGYLVGNPNQKPNWPVMRSESVREWPSLGIWTEGKTIRDPYILRTDVPSVCLGSDGGLVPVRKPNFTFSPNNPQTVDSDDLALARTTPKRRKSGKTNKTQTTRKGDVWDRRVRETVGMDCYGRSRTEAKLRREIRKVCVREDGSEYVRVISTRIGWEFLQEIPRTQAELTEITNKNRTEVAGFVRSLFTNPNKFRVKYWEGILEQFVQDVLGSLCGATPVIAKQKPNAPAVRDPFLPKFGATEQYPNGRPMWLIVYALCSATIRAERKHNIRVRPTLVHIFDGHAADAIAFGKRLDGRANPNKARSLAASRQQVSRTISELVTQTEAERMSVLSARERQVWVLVGRGLTGRTIAEQLGVSPTRVSKLIANIREKLGIKNQLTQA